eukprot:3436523-Amphidinium_carterae.1
MHATQRSAATTCLANSSSEGIPSRAFARGADGLAVFARQHFSSLWTCVVLCRERVRDSQAPESFCLHGLGSAQRLQMFTASTGHLSLCVAVCWKPESFYMESPLAVKITVDSFHICQDTLAVSSNYLDSRGLERHFNGTCRWPYADKWGCGVAESKHVLPNLRQPLWRESPLCWAYTEQSHMLHDVMCL